MSIQQQINDDIKKAMLAKAEADLRGLRAIKSAFLLALSEKDAGETLTDEKAIQVIQKLAKQRKDSMDIYLQNGRQDLADKEKEELNVLEKYLPKAMLEEELESFLRQLVQELGISSKAEMGKVMPEAIKRLAGQADGKSVNQCLGKILV